MSIDDHNIKEDQLKAWFKAVESLDNETVRDYLLTLLFTGMRQLEAARLRWTDVDLTNNTITVGETKARRPRTLPVSDYLHGLLLSRRQKRTSDFVFPEPDGAGHIVDVRCQIAHVIDESGINFTIHDLRRTFLAAAARLDISYYTWVRLANHKVEKDVTAGYPIANVEDLRKPMQQITDYLKEQAQIETRSRKRGR